MTGIKNSYNFFLYVECTTFNHAGFVKDALNGFCIQKTDFPFVCIILDDASTDGTQNVIKEYVFAHFNVTSKEDNDDYTLLFAQHKENESCFFAAYFLKYNHYSIGKSKQCYLDAWNIDCKYMAICEGDDYWTIPEKLQIQVNYLEEHPEITLSCHRYTILDVDTKSTEEAHDKFLENKNTEEIKGYEFDLKYNYLKQWTSKSLTLVIRKSAINNEYKENFAYARDLHNVYFILKKGNGVCHNFFGGVYRMNNPSSIYGNRSLEEKLRINYFVLKEFSEKIEDPVIKKMYKYRMIAYYLSQFKSNYKNYYYSLLLVRGVDYLVDSFKLLFCHYPKRI